MNDDELYNYFTKKDLEDQHKIKGASQKQINNLDWKKFAEVLLETKDSNCIICQEDFK